MEAKDAYKQKLAAQLKELSIRIDMLEISLDNVGADLRIEHAEQLHEFRAKHRVAAKKMKELETPTC